MKSNTEGNIKYNAMFCYNNMFHFNVLFCIHFDISMSHIFISVSFTLSRKEDKERSKNNLHIYKNNFSHWDCYKIANC